MRPWQLADNADNAVVDKGGLKAGGLGRVEHRAAWLLLFFHLFH
jgi:hypothetical protein